MSEKRPLHKGMTGDEVRGGRDTVVRRIHVMLDARGFLRGRPRRGRYWSQPPILFARLHEFTADIVILGKKRSGPEFTVSATVRGLADPSEHLPLHGPDCQAYGFPNPPGGIRYDFAYHKAPETVDRCVKNIIGYVDTVLEPWFATWRDPRHLLTGARPDPSLGSVISLRVFKRVPSPFSPDEAAALARALEGDASGAGKAVTSELLGLSANQLAIHAAGQDADAVEDPKALILALCREALEMAPRQHLPDLPVYPASGQPEMYAFESLAWELGERIRQLVVGRRALKKDPEVMAAIVEVVTRSQLRRGRESFVMLLDHVAAAEHAPTVARFLDDPDIRGHAVDTLLKMRVAGYAAAVAPLRDHEMKWIRDAAKRYLRRFPDEG